MHFHWRNQSKFNPPRKTLLRSAVLSEGSEITWLELQMLRYLAKSMWTVDCHVPVHLKRCWMGLRLGLCEIQLGNNLWTGKTISLWNWFCFLTQNDRKGLSLFGQTDVSLWAVAETVPFTGTKGNCSNHDKEPDHRGQKCPLGTKWLHTTVLAL